jgi:hypothetical protein
MASRKKLKVTMRSVIQRINRKLAADGEVLRAARSARARFDHGDYFVVSERAGIHPSHVDPEEMARELGVLKTWEQVE